MDDQHPPADPREAQRPSQPAEPHVVTTPPTVRGQFRPVQSPPAWPTAIGVVSIVLGSLGILASLGGIASYFVMEFVADIAATSGENIPVPWTTTMLLAQTAYAVAAMGVSLLLLIAGIGMVRRRRWSISATYAWAWIKIAMTIIQAGLTFWVQSQQFQLMEEAIESQDQSGSGPPPGMLGVMGTVFGSIALILTLLWGLAWPLVCLLWLHRKPVRVHYQSWS